MCVCKRKREGGREKDFDGLSHEMKRNKTKKTDFIVDFVCKTYSK